ncbi:MAG TPA: hypothetical protein VHA13_01090, partial [Gammaproteobacteria bacterium]|nr:hypothetical protein [Gammaproteobacteria bacterium]
MPAPIPELGNLAPTPKPQSATSTPTPKPGAFNKAETEDQKPEEDQKKGDGKEQSDDLIKEFMKKLSELIAFIMQASKGEEQQNEQKKQEEEQFSPQNLLKMLGKITAALDKSKDQEKDFSEKMN